MNKPRGKPQQQRDHDGAHSYSCVASKLTTLLRPPFSDFLHPVFDQAAHTISRIGYEASILANMHVLRCFNEGLEPEVINQSFFYSCCSNVSASIKTAGSENLKATAEAYFGLRPEGFNVMDTELLSPAMSSLAREMETMAKNHI